MKRLIVNRFTDDVIWEGEAESTRAAVLAAIAAGADLSGAHLSGAHLSGADLTGAHLAGADLSDAHLSGAHLSGAHLSGADLTGAHLSGADLTGAHLAGADLAGADLTGADLTGAHLSGAPIIPSIHQAVYAAASQPEALDMHAWHTCETTHCRAGWVVTLAGKPGLALEDSIGTPAAAALIYLRSDPSLGKVPNFYASNDAALADMQRLAAAEAERESVQE